MKIIDGTMSVELADDDPRTAKVRAVLFEPSPTLRPLAVLWDQCIDSQRRLLAEIAVVGEIGQDDLEQVLQTDAVGLRGRLGGLAKTAKRIGVDYPVRSVGTRREVRRFSLLPDLARQVQALANHNSPRGTSA